MCIFCQIIEGSIPSYKVMENPHAFAFLDINPTTPGHTLVVPRSHYGSLEEIPLEELREIIGAVQEVGERMKSKLSCPAYNLIVNNGSEAGQAVPHLHFHIIPRRPGDGLEPWPGKKYMEGEAEEIISRLNS